MFILQTVFCIVTRIFTTTQELSQQLLFSLNYCLLIHSNALQTGFFSIRFFHGRKCLQGKQSDLGLYCLQYKLNKNIYRPGKQTKVAK